MLFSPQCLQLFSRWRHSLSLMFRYTNTKSQMHNKIYTYKLLLYRANVYYVCFSLSLVWVPFSAALSLGNFFILGLRGGPLSTVEFIWTLECDRAAWVACADPLIIPYCLSSSDVWSHGSASSSSVSLSDNWSLGVLILGIFFSTMVTNTGRIECIL